MNRRIVFGGVKPLTDTDIPTVSGCDAPVHAASRRVIATGLLHRRE